MEGTTDANDTVDPQMTSHPNPETLQPEVDKTTHQEQPDIVMQDVEIQPKPTTQGDKPDSEDAESGSEQEDSDSGEEDSAAEEAARAQKLAAIEKAKREKAARLSKLASAAQQNNTPVEEEAEGIVCPPDQDPLLSQLPDNEAIKSNLSMAPYFGCTVGEYANILKSDSISRITSIYNFIMLKRDEPEYPNFSTIRAAIADAANNRSSKYRDATIDNCGEFDSYDLSAWAVVRLHEILFDSQNAVLAGKGIPPHLELDKAFALLRHARRIFNRSQTRKTAKDKAARISPPRSTGKPRVTNATKKALKASRENQPPTRERILAAIDRETDRVIQRSMARAAEMDDAQRAKYDKLKKQPKTKKTKTHRSDELAELEERMSSMVDQVEALEAQQAAYADQATDEDELEVSNQVDLYNEQISALLERIATSEVKRRALAEGCLADITFLHTDGRDRRGLMTRSTKTKIGTFDNHERPAYTHDPNNPRQTWFKDGLLIGGEEMRRLQGYKGVDWIDGNRPGPNYNPGRPNVLRPPKPPVTGNSSAATAATPRADATSHPGNPSDPANQNPATPSDPAEAPEGEFETTLDETPREMPPVPGPDTSEEQKALDEALQARIARFQSLYEATYFEPGKSKARGTATTTHASKSQFASALLKESHLESATLVPNGEESEQLENEAGVLEKEISFADPLNKKYRENQEWFAKLCKPGKSRMQPDDLKKALTNLYVRSRSHPMLPNQTGRHSLWWQLTAANEMLERMEKQRADPNEPRGNLVSDQVGIGKTDTVGLTHVAENNNRDRDIQRLYDNQDWDGLAAYPDPKPLIIVTQPHLVVQMATDAANISSKNRVYLYSSNVFSGLPDNVGIISETLTRDHKIFDPSDPTNNRVVVVVSYNRLLTRNGHTSAFDWLRENAPGVSHDELNSKLDAGVPQEWPGNLAGCFRRGILDECQATKGLGSKSTTSLMYLDCPWWDLVTATPIPWKAVDFGGLLHFLQNPAVNRQALKLLHSGQLCDPYQIDDSGRLVNPDFLKYAYTLVAFQRFIIGQDLERHEQGRRIGMIWSKIMIRRDYNSSCVVHPDGSRHVIGDSMPDARSVRLHLDNDIDDQAAYDTFAATQTSKMVLKDESNPDQHFVNGRVTRLLNLMSSNPYLYYATPIHHVRVPNRSAKRSSKKGEEPMMHNPVLDEFKKLFDAKEDVQFLRKLMVMMIEGAALSQEALKSKHSPYSPTLPEPGAPNEGYLLASAFIMNSIRFRVLLANLADQIAFDDKKAIVYTQSPFEQQLVTVILRLFDIKAEGLLAAGPAAHKNDLVRRFNSRLSRHQTPAQGTRTTDPADDIEVLVLSYFMNSGLNLHYQCPYLHAFSPPLSQSISIQANGRIVRFGQPSKCLVIEYLVTGTFNARQIGTAISNALVGEAALLTGELLTAEENENNIQVTARSKDLDCWVIDAGKIYDLRDPKVKKRIRNKPKATMGDVILFRMQSQGPINMKVKMSQRNAGKGNSSIQSIRPVAAMYAAVNDLPVTKKAAATPKRQKPSASKQETEARTKALRKQKEKDVDGKSLAARTRNQLVLDEAVDAGDGSANTTPASNHDSNKYDSADSFIDDREEFAEVSPTVRGTYSSSIAQTPSVGPSFGIGPSAPRDFLSRLAKNEIVPKPLRIKLVNRRGASGESSTATGTFNLADHTGGGAVQGHGKRKSSTLEPVEKKKQRTNTKASTATAPAAGSSRSTRSKPAKKSMKLEKSKEIIENSDEDADVDMDKA